MAQDYKIDILNYSANDSVKSNCADITFYNNGVETVVVNNALQLIGGQSIALTANHGEMDKTIYSFRFLDQGFARSFVVFRKVYI